MVWSEWVDLTLGIKLRLLFPQLCQSINCRKILVTCSYFFKIPRFQGNSLFFQDFVEGVLLITPSSVMFDPSPCDPLAAKHGCEKFGIMCSMTSIVSAAMFCNSGTVPKYRSVIGCFVFVARFFSSALVSAQWSETEACVLSMTLRRTVPFQHW